MKYLFTGAIVASLAFSTAAFAHEGVVHYEVETPADHAAAIELLDGKTQQIGEILEKEALDGNDLEKVHEYTYSLEAAVDKLRTEAKSEAQEDAVDAADEAVQALHYASENHEEATAREWYGKLTPAVATLESDFAAKAE